MFISCVEIWRLSSCINLPLTCQSMNSLHIKSARFSVYLKHFFKTPAINSNGCIRLGSFPCLHIELAHLTSAGSTVTCYPLVSELYTATTSFLKCDRTEKRWGGGGLMPLASCWLSEWHGWDTEPSVVGPILTAQLINSSGMLSPSLSLSFLPASLHFSQPGLAGD